MSYVICLVEGSFCISTFHRKLHPQPVKREAPAVKPTAWWCANRGGHGIYSINMEYYRMDIDTNIDKDILCGYTYIILY